MPCGDRGQGDGRETRRTCKRAASSMVVVNSGRLEFRIDQRRRSAPSGLAMSPLLLDVRPVLSHRKRDSFVSGTRPFIR